MNDPANGCRTKSTTAKPQFLCPTFVRGLPLSFHSKALQDRLWPFTSALHFLWHFRAFMFYTAKWVQGGLICYANYLSMARNIGRRTRRVYDSTYTGSACLRITTSVVKYSKNIKRLVTIYTLTLTLNKSCHFCKATLNSEFQPSKTTHKRLITAVNKNISLREEQIRRWRPFRPLKTSIFNGKVN